MAEPLNISMIERQLCVERLEAPGKLAWLEKSYRDPLAFGFITPIPGEKHPLWEL
jgi:hypothetical protein